MAGSRGGKNSKGKGKYKSKTYQKKPEAFDPKVDDQSQVSNKAHEMGTSNRKNPMPRAYTESELEQFIYLKLEDAYAKAKNWLLSRGYVMEDIERAFLNGSYFHGPLDQLMNHIWTTSVTFIEQKEVLAKGETLKDRSELYETMLETLVGLVLHAEPLLKLQRADAMWLLLVRSWGYFPSTTTTSHLRSFLSRLQDASAPDSSSAAEKVPSVFDITWPPKKVRVLERINCRPALVSQLRQNVPNLVATIREEVGASVIEKQDLEDGSGGITEGSDILCLDFLTFLDEECLNITRWLERHPNDPKSAIIFDMMINIKNLQEKVNVNKEWAQRKVRDSARRLSKDLLDLRILKIEKVDAEYWKDEKFRAEQSSRLMLREVEFSVRSVNCELRFMEERVSNLEINNAKYRAEIEALKMSASEYEGDLKEVLNKERKYKKKNSNFEKQTLNFNAECDIEMQRGLQLQLEDSQAEKEIEESKGKWRHEIVEKENMLALLAEEARKATMQKACSRLQLMKLHEELDIKNQLKKDEHLRLEDELSRLRLSHQSSNLSLEGDDFLYDKDQKTSSSSYRKCICCFDNDVCVVLLPCTHQVLCGRCYEENYNIVGDHCPYCHVEIQQGIKVFGHSS